MSIAVFEQVLKNTDLVGSERTAMMVMAWKCGNDLGGSLYPSMGKIAATLNVTETHARRLIHSLIEQGYLEVIGNEKGGKGQSRQYQIRLEKLCPSPPSDGSASGQKGDIDVTLSASKASHSCDPLTDEDSTKGSHVGSKGSHTGSQRVTQLCEPIDKIEKKERVYTTPPSTSESKSKARAHKPSLGVELLIGKGVERQHAEDWLQVRRDNRKPLTISAWARIERAALKAKVPEGIIVKICAEKSWVSLDAEWDSVTKLVEQATKVAPVDHVIEKADPVLVKLRQAWPDATRDPSGRIRLSSLAGPQFIDEADADRLLANRKVAC